MSGAAGEATLRLFVALELADSVRRAVSEWGRCELAPTAGLRLVGGDALHVTLCFLGATPASELDAIGAACREAAGGRRPLRLSFGRAFALPRRRPRVVAVAIAAASGERDPPTDPRVDAGRDPGAGAAPGDVGALGELQTALSARLAAGGWYRPEARPFLAHLTVARVRSQRRLDARALERLRPIEATAFTADTVTVFRSRTHPAGARYEALARVELAAGS